MSDDFLKDHQADWRAQPDDFTAARDRLQRERWKPHVQLAAAIASAVVGIVTGVVFAAMATATGKLLFVMAAVVMGVGLPGAMAISVVLQRKAFVWDDETPESLLRTGVRRADATLRTARFGWSAFVLIGGFILALWVAERLGYIEETWFVIVYTVVGAVTLGFAWLGMRGRIDRLQRERANLARLLAELEAAGDPETEGDGAV
jgi:Na+/melibiose symporter-like transporter